MIESKESARDKLKRWLISILVLAIIAIISYLGFLYYQDYQNKRIISKQNALDSLNIEFKRNENNIVIRKIEYGKDDIDLKDYVLKHTGDLEINPSKIDSSKLGRLDVIYTLKTTDEYNQEVKKEFKKDFVVYDSNKPIIEILNESISINENEEYDLKNNVKVYDLIDGDLKYSEALDKGTYIFEGDYDLSKANEYEIIVKAKDINNNESNDSFKLIVNKVIDEKKEDNQIIIPPAIETNNEENNNETNNEVIVNNQEENKPTQEEKPVENKLAEEKPTTEKPKEEKPVEEKPSENNNEVVEEKKEESGFQYQIVNCGESWDGPKLTRSAGVVNGPSGKETYYNLDMDVIVRIMRNQGYSEEEYPYWVRDDGCKMLGNYIMIAADFNTRPRGTIVQTSLGCGIVCDTGGFASENPTQVDIAVDW